MEELSLTQIGFVIALTNLFKELLPWFSGGTPLQSKFKVSLLVVLTTVLVYYGSIILAVLPPELQTLIITALGAAGLWSTTKNLTERVGAKANGNV